MPAVYSPPGGSSLPIFVSSAQTDQIGLNTAPTSSTFQWLTSPHTNFGVYSNTWITQTDRDYAGGDTVRNVKAGIRCDHLVSNNDPTYPPISIVACGFRSNIYSGFQSPSYGTTINFLAQNVIQQVPSPHGNEYSCLFATMNAGTKDAPITGGNYWFFDNAVFGPIGGQPGRMVGYSFVTNNYYNGSPQYGPACAVSIQTAPKIGGGNQLTCTGGVSTGASATTYPWDIGYFISGYSTGGTGDGYTNAVQVGGLPGVWIGAGLAPPLDSYGGDVGQVARGVVVKAKNAGGSVSRLGAFVSEGTGEGGGLILGLDTNDASRVSIYRPSAGVLASTIAGLAVRHGGVIYEALSAGTAIANSTAQTSLLSGVSTSLGSLIIPANLLVPGKIIRPTFFGTSSNAGSVTMTLSVWLGSTMVWGITTPALTTTPAPLIWHLNSTYVASGLQVQAVGSSGKVIGILFGSIGTAGSVASMVGGTAATVQTSNFLAPVAVTVDTTATLTFDIRAQWSVASASNTLQLLGGFINIDG